MEIYGLTGSQEPRDFTRITEDSRLSSDTNVLNRKGPILPSGKICPYRTKTGETALEGLYLSVSISDTVSIVVVTVGGTSVGVYTVDRGT